ncbi:MAG: thioredoxin-disulfide reductase [Paramuribaculum sp.]|nr:thioredoxin-disulfide reductase [Paramuribaculum sp.]MDE7470146.1 thioredoxin-disulfide reductase [Paramuribaculum sp.]
METLKTRCLIIGSGPAGFTSAIYASRANLGPLLYEGHQPGGQLTTTTEVENFPGYPAGVTGNDMMEDMRSQARRFGADIRSGIITEIDLDKRPFHAKASDGNEIIADTVIISTGASAKYLGIPDEKKYQGLGVSACATCDGFFYRKRRVAVVGGGDTACEEALYLSNIATDVFLIVRKDYLRASKVMQKRVLENPNIKVLFNTNTIGLYGEEYLEGAHLVEHKGTDQERHYDLPIDGFFLAIGHHPNTALFGGKIETDEQGYIKTALPTTATNIPGVFAAGDVADPRYRQAITAAGSGCRAALDVERFLMDGEA